MGLHHLAQIEVAPTKHTGQGGYPNPNPNPNPNPKQGGRMISSLTHQGQQPAVRGAEAAYADEAVAEDVLQLAHLRAHTRQAQPCARMHTMHMRMRMHMHIHMY